MTNKDFIVTKDALKCTCDGHRFPGVMHMVACCDEPHIDQKRRCAYGEYNYPWHEGTMPLTGKVALQENARPEDYQEVKIYLCKEHYLQVFGEIRAGDFSLA